MAYFMTALDHVFRTIALIPARLKKPRLVAFFEVIAAEVQELELAIWETIGERYLSTAVGAQLDQYGRLLEQPRNGLSDEDYRAVLQVTILVNRSNGEIDRILTIAKIMFAASDVQYAPIFPAAFWLSFQSGSVPVQGARRRLAIDAILRARPAGVGLEMILETTDRPFGFAEDPGAFGFDDGDFAEDIFAGMEG